MVHTVINWLIKHTDLLSLKEGRVASFFYCILSAVYIFITLVNANIDQRIET